MGLHRSADNKRSQKDLIEDIHIALYGDGNGKPGLTIKVDRLETWMYRVVPKGLIVVTATCSIVWWIAITFSHK